MAKISNFDTDTASYKTFATHYTLHEIYIDKGLPYCSFQNVTNIPRLLNIATNVVQTFKRTCRLCSIGVDVYIKNEDKKLHTSRTMVYLNGQFEVAICRIGNVKSG